MKDAWPWLTLVLLGAYHGVNPGMGWLFALSLGLQEKSRRAIGYALFPIALGHASAIALTVLLARLLQAALSPRILQLVVAGTLFALGAYRMLRARHPRGGGMRVGGRDLFFWSFLMASAHGAGLMLLPILLARPRLGMSHSMHHTPWNFAGTGAGLLGLAVAIHTLALLAVAGTLALLIFQFYEKSGLRLLQYAWFNFDLLWAIALFAAGVAALLT
jgi:hypothetical protein